MDEITVTLPRERPFSAVAGLVLGGVAARHDLTLEVLEDLRLALETLLECEDGGRDLTAVLRIETGNIEVSVGPFDQATVAELEEEAGEAIGLRRLLDAVVDGVSVNERADGCWVDLTKAAALAEGSR